MQHEITLPVQAWQSLAKIIADNNPMKKVEALVVDIRQRTHEAEVSELAITYDESVTSFFLDLLTTAIPMSQAERMVYTIRDQINRQIDKEQE